MKLNGSNIAAPAARLSDRVLESLRKGGAATTWALVMRLGMQAEARSKQSIATALQHLERAGLVGRVFAPHDKRIDGLWWAL